MSLKSSTKLVFVFFYVLDFFRESVIRLTITATTEYKLFIDGIYAGWRGSWEYQYVIDIQFNTQVSTFI